MPKLFTITETAQQLKISRSALYDLLKKGSLKNVKLGKRSFITESELSRFIESLETEGAAK
ncbi:MAG: helix-turn-helix domain-containing protein [Arcanobacterium sp.]|nr:helix-turn-helix domain-containing protein [Arcanobacterium sp.]